MDKAVRRAAEPARDPGLALAREELVAGVVHKAVEAALRVAGVALKAVGVVPKVVALVRAAHASHSTFSISVLSRHAMHPRPRTG